MKIKHLSMVAVLLLAYANSALPSLVLTTSSTNNGLTDFYSDSGVYFDLTSKTLGNLSITEIQTSVFGTVGQLVSATVWVCNDSYVGNDSSPIG